MYLKRIEIQGFKSFANKTVLEFPRTTTTFGIAAIVGPNGSGKSNIVDAIRWVLGEQSLKSLRGKKSQDVIFSGSESKGKLGMASVALHIDNTDGSVDIDYPELVIARKLYRSGESEYLINGAKARLQDVLLLIAKSNFGQKSYSIVSQGSIDRVILATPAERKEYFDEAVGVKQFQIKRDGSINKLENAWNNLLQVDALLTEITPRLHSLTRAVKRLERREQVEKELREKEHAYYGWLWHELEREINAIKPGIAAAESELKEYSNQLHAKQQQFVSLEKEDSRSKNFGEIQSRYQKLLEQKNNLREEQLMLQNKIELAKQRLTQKGTPLPLPEIITRLKTIDKLQLNIVRNLASDEASKLKAARDDIKTLAKHVADLIEALEQPKDKTIEPAPIDPSLTEDLVAVGKDLTELEVKIESVKKELEAFNQTEEQKKGKFFSLQRELSAIQVKYNQQSQTASNLRVDMARLETRQQDLKKEIIDELTSLDWLNAYAPKKVDTAGLHPEIQKLRHQLELIGGVEPEVVEEYHKVKERHDFLSEQAEDLRNSIQSLEKIINDLDEKIQVQFDSSFKHINKSFTTFFNTLFGGGKAELTLIKEDLDAKPATETNPEIHAEHAGLEPQTESILDQLQDAENAISPKRFLKKRTGKVITGIDIVATPPGKKVSSIGMLSGGERSLTSIALICAVIFNNPSPFVVLDEVDAALDEANSSRFGKIVEELAHKTQFIVITHNRATMHKASMLYGVTMAGDGTSKVISLKFEEAAKVVRQ